MGYFDATAGPVSPDEHVKALKDEELLDFWEDSQYLEGMLQECMYSSAAGGYERLIVQELQLRTCRRHVGRSLSDC